APARPRQRHRQPAAGELAAFAARRWRGDAAQRADRALAAGAGGLAPDLHRRRAQGRAAAATAGGRVAVTPVATADLRARTVRSLGWQLLGSGGQRCVQFAGLAATARLLAARQEDIGLFGVVLAVIASIEALTAFTGEQAQIHSRRGGERAFIDTVF